MAFPVAWCAGSGGSAQRSGGPVWASTAVWPGMAARPPSMRVYPFDMAATAAEVAEWMVEQLEGRRELYQHEAAHHIRLKFGNDFVYLNQNGNYAISRDVLREFRKRTEDTVVWERGWRAWRRRTERDRADKRQVG
jgi:hypothetical protein